MKIKYKIYLTSLILVILALVQITSTLVLSEAITEYNKKMITNQQIAAKSASLSYLTQEYINVWTPRIREQWFLEFNELKNQLQSHLTDAQSAKYLSLELTELGTIRHLFNKLNELRQRKESGFDEVNYNQLHNRLVSRLMSETRQLMDQAHVNNLQLTEELNCTKAGLVSRQSTLSILLVTAIMVSCIFLNKWFNHPLQKLLRGINTISSGHLEHRVETDEPNEFSEVAEAFNLMTANIIKTTIAREKLSNQLQCEQKIRNHLKHVALTDELTGIGNRRHCMDQLKKRIQENKRYHHPLCIILMDIDDFKTINDTYGHDAGDAVLKRMCQMAEDTIRTTDSIYRLGGDEFVIIMPETEVATAQTAVERLISLFDHHIVKYNEQKIHFSCSAGMAQFEPKTMIDENELLVVADKALYEAKKAGKNCCRS